MSFDKVGSNYSPSEYPQSGSSDPAIDKEATFRLQDQKRDEKPIEQALGSSVPKEKAIGKSMLSQFTGVVKLLFNSLIRWDLAHVARDAAKEGGVLSKDYPPDVNGVRCNSFEEYAAAKYPVGSFWLDPPGPHDTNVQFKFITKMAVDSEQGFKTESQVLTVPLTFRETMHFQLALQNANSREEALEILSTITKSFCQETAKAIRADYLAKAKYPPKDPDSEQGEREIRTLCNEYRRWVTAAEGTAQYVLPYDPRSA